MKSSINARHGRAAAQANSFKLGPIAAGCVVMMLAASAAQAQQAAPEPASPAKAEEKKPAETKLDAVVVTGIRRGIENAIKVKKDSDSIIEVISAEDIGKLPDTSIAESIARLPGLAAQRVAGRAQVISVRGLAPDFATTLLNGREQVSTGDNRGVEFDQYPSELLASVVIYKTPDAALVGQGLSGTFDLQTVKPLSFGSRTIALNLRGERNSLSKGADYGINGNRFSATYIDQFADRTVGLALGYAHLDSPIRADEFGTYGFNTDGRPGLAAGTSNTNGLKTYSRTGKNKRDGFIGVLEFKASPVWTSVVDGYYSKFKRTETARGIETNLGDYNGGNSPGLNYTATTIQNGTLVGATATGVYPLVRGLYNDREDKLTSLGWNNKFKLDGWSLIGDVSYSRADKKEVNLETNAQYVGADGKPVLDTAVFNFNTGSFPTVAYGLDYADPARILIGNSIYGAGYGKTPKVKDVLKSVKLEASLPTSSVLPEAFEGLDVGLNYAGRTKNKRQPEASLSSAGASLIGSGSLLTPANLGFAGAPSALTWNVPSVLAANYNPFVPVDNLSYLIPKTWNVKEKVLTTFAKLKIDSQVGGVGLRGNVGVQVIRTDQSSASNYFDASAPAGSQIKPNDDGKTYTDVLPSVNLAFQFEGQQTLRLAAAKQLARPRLDQLKSALEFDVDKTTLKPSANGGNPKLDPWRANALDISYEKYFATKGYVAVAGFYKDLKTYIFQQKDPNYDLSKLTPGTPATTNFGTFETPLNGKGGTLKGLELSVSVPFNLLTPELDGFGASASYTVSTSAIKIDNTNLGNSISLPGLSKNVSNLTAYYEKYGFSTRISRRSRSDFIGEITGFGNDRELRYTKGERVVDFQLGYDFNEGTFKGLGLLLQVNNLTNSAYQTYAVTPDRPVEYQKYGRTVLFGLNYKL